MINCFTSVYAGFSVFAVLGFIAQMKNVEVADVADAGNIYVLIAIGSAQNGINILHFCSLTMIENIAI